MTGTGDPSLDGGCTCGAVRYRMTTKPMFVHCCHCTWCQRESGAAFALNAMIEADRVVLLQGEPGSGHHSRPTAARGRRWCAARAAISPCGATTPGLATRCASCGSALSTSPAGYRPTSTSSPPPNSPGSCCPEGTPAVEAYYDRKAYWPAESLWRAARRSSGRRSATGSRPRAPLGRRARRARAADPRCRRFGCAARPARRRQRRRAP